jgi:transposase
MENTGIYHRHLWKFCNYNGLPVYIENAARIKWGMGITRSKSDKIDSRRLALYACKHIEEMKAAPSVNCTLMKLKDLMSFIVSYYNKKTV